MANADIKLDGSTAIVEGNCLRVNCGEMQIPGKIKQNHVRIEGHDLHLDHPQRRRRTSGARRALVHGANDQLIINYNHDYPGHTVVHGDLEVQRCNALRVRSKENYIVFDASKNGYVNVGARDHYGSITLWDNEQKQSIKIDTKYRSMYFKDYYGRVKVRIDTDRFTESDWPAWPGQSVPSYLDLIKELRRMKEEILTLRAEVDELKAGG